MNTQNPLPARQLFWLFLCAGLATAPMWFAGFSCGHDLTFHMESWMDAAHSWRQGNAYPRWSGSAAWGAGEPRFIFYPPLSWMLGGLLGAIFGWNAAPFIFVLLVLFIAGIAMRHLAAAWMSPRTATLAGCLYIANPYNLFVIYTRAAMAELLAAAVIPWLLAEALRPRIRVATFALAFATVWLTNAPAAVFATYSVAILLIVRAAQQRSVRNWFPAACGVALGAALDAFYILPAAYERRFVQPSQILTGAYDFHSNFLFTHTADALHDFILREASIVGFTLALLAAVAAAVLFTNRSRNSIPNPTFALLSLGVVVLIMQTRPTAFLWAHLPELALPQFPWRWYAVLGIVFAFVTAAALYRIPRTQTILAASIVCIAIGICYPRFRQPCDPEDTPAGIRAQFLGNGFEPQDEYVPTGADADDLRPDPGHPGYPRVWLYRADDAADISGPADEHVRMLAPVQIDQWLTEKKSFRAHVSTPAIAILQLQDNPAWRITLNDQTRPPLTHASSGQMQIAMPPGDDVVAIRFTRTRDRTIADIISAIAALLWIAIFAFEQRPGEPAAHIRHHVSSNP